MTGPRWRLEVRKREPTEAEAGWHPKTLEMSTVILTDLESGEERVLGKVARHGGGGPSRWISGLGFVPGARYAWVMTGVSWLGEEDYTMNVFPVDRGEEHFQVTCTDEPREGDLRFAPDGSAIFSRRGHELMAGGEWIERSPLPPGGPREKLQEWPEGLVAREDLDEPSGEVVRR